VHLLSVVAIAVGAMVSTRPSAAGGQSPFPFRSATNLVALNVTVQDGKSRYVTGLQPADFAVYEDGVQQNVRFFESRSIPIDLIVLIDTSTSMFGQAALVQAAARGFLDTLRPGDRGAVVNFDDRVTIRQDLTSDKAALLRAVDSTRGRGFTAMHTALYVVLKHFGAAVRTDGAIRRQAIVLLSDGEDNASLLSFEDVLAIARQTGVNIYTVRLKTGDEVDWRRDLQMARAPTETDFQMKTLARETGAIAFFPRAEQLQGVYGTISDEIASQYSIGYEPANPRADGSFRRVTVRILTGTELRARTRSGYSAEAVRVTGPR
jgi:VWFA-related protein